MAITIDVTPKNTTISPTEGVTTTLDITTSIPTISSFRPLINAIDVGGDGSLTYNSSDGNFTYTGPSATEVRAHLSAGTGVSYSSGQFSIGQDVATNATPTFTSTTVAQSNIRNGAAPYLNFYNAKNIAGGLSTSSTEFTGVIPFYGIAIDTDNSDAESYKPAARIFTKFSNCTESALAGQMVFEVTKAGATNWSMAGPNPKNVMVLDPGTVTIGVSGTSNALDLTDLVVNGSLDINGDADISGNLTGVDTLTATNLVGTLATANRNEIFSNVSGDITIAAGGAATIQATSVENSMLAGFITNAKLSNSTITVSDGSNTSPVALGGTLSFTGTSNEVTVAENAGTVTIGLPDDVTVGGDLVVTGDLTVNGTETILNSTTLTVDDKNIVLGNVDTPTDTTADGGGITLKGTTDKTLNWVDSTDSWTSSEHFELASTKTFRINANEVLNQTTLGSTVLASSLTSVGALDSGSITSNFSDIDIGDNVVTAAEFVGDLRGAVRFQAKAGESLAKGDVVYISGVSGQKPVVSKAQANSAATMPSFGLANAAVSANANIEVISFGTFAHGNTTGGAEEWEFGDILYVSAATAGALTNVKPAGAANLIQNVGKVERVHASSGSIMVAGAGRTAATPNLDTGKFFIGDSNNYSTAGSFNNQFTNTSGTISLNGANITTVGTIGTGTWQGTAIANDYIGNHSAAKLTSGTIAAERLPDTALLALGTSSTTALAGDTSLFSGSYADLTNKPTLGTAAATASSDYATATQGTKADNALVASTVSAYGATIIDDADAATARTTLGLGTAATTDATAYATATQGTKADNALVASTVSAYGATIIDDADAATARTTLGLGTAATTAATAYAPAAGSSNIVTTGALNTGSITSGFTSIDIGTGALTAGDTTVNGSLSVNSTSADTTYSPEIVLERNGGAAAGDDGDKLGVITFKGDDTSGTQAVYAQIGARIVDDGADNANTKGEIRIACGYNSNAVTLEDPSLRIDHLGTWINETQIDGSPANTSFYNVSSGGTSGIKYWATASSGYGIEVKSATPTADRDIKFPDVSGFVVVSGVAGGSMNGGGGLGTAQTAWSPAQFMANANTDYYHYTDASTDVDLLVAVPFSGIDLGEFGAKYTFRNISANANSKITIDLDGFTSGSSQGATQYYAINKYDGSTPSLITSASADLVISAGGVIEMSPISSAVWHVTGTGFA